MGQNSPGGNTFVNKWKSGPKRSPEGLSRDEWIKVIENKTKPMWAGGAATLAKKQRQILPTERHWPSGTGTRSSGKKEDKVCERVRRLVERQDAGF